jgi:hypothetical protein
VPAVDRWRTAERVALALLLVVALGEAAYIWWNIEAPTFITGGRGTVSVESRPPNVQVVVDGEVRGTTPLTLRLSAGAHVLEVRAGSHARVLPITVQADTVYSQYVELPSAQASGAIDIREPAGARVLVDGRLRGTVPLKVADLEPGAHDVLIEGRGVRSRQSVQVQAGLTTTLGNVPVAAAGLSRGTPAPETGPGWVTVRAPYEMQVLEGERVLGTTSRERLELSAGWHELTIVSETLGFRKMQAVEVSPGRETTVAVQLPKGQLTLVCDPPAEVFVDGERAGETPILNMPVAVGPHEVTFRHPELGEEHHAVTVTASTPVRLDVKLKPGPALAPAQ